MELDPNAVARQANIQYRPTKQMDKPFWIKVYRPIVFVWIKHSLTMGANV